MTLTDFFPLDVGQTLTKENFHVLLAATKERLIKRIKFQVGFNRNNGSFSCGDVTTLIDNEFTTFAFLNSNSDSSTQSHLEYLYTVIDLLDQRTANSLRYLPYEDLIVGDYVFSSSKPKYGWSSDTVLTDGYFEKDLIFMIKDASLYYIKNGIWVKDEQEVIILNNDKIYIRFLNELNGIYRANVLNIQASDAPLSSFVDVLDALFAFKQERNDAIGGLIDVNGSILSSNDIAGPSQTFSPSLLYTDNFGSSSVALENDVDYRKLVLSTDVLDIFPYFLFTIRPDIDPNILTEEEFEFVQNDYFLSSYYTLQNMVLIKNNSFENNLPKPSFTSSFINCLYYLVDYLKYFDDIANGTHGSCGCNGVSLTVSDSFTLSSILATYSAAGAMTNTTLTLGSCPAPVGAVSSGGTFIFQGAIFGGATISSSASVAGDGLIAIPPNTATNGSDSSISSPSMVWRKSTAGAFPTGPLNALVAGATCYCLIDLTTVLEIK